MKIYGMGLSAFDPSQNKRFAVVCEEHNETISFGVDDFAVIGARDDRRAFETIARLAIYDHCTGCIFARASIASKWPEGAEL